MSLRTILSLTAVVGLCAPVARADEAAPLSALAKMPVKEVTIFKDGHALMLHEGKMPVEGSGNVLMDYLPAPVLGTFWPYSADKEVKLTGVVAGQRKVLVERTALSVQELLEGNVGAEVIVNETPLSLAATKPEGLTYAATVVGLPVRSSKELETVAPPGEGEKLPEKGKIILLKTSEGVRAVGMDRIQQVTFRGPHKAAVASEEFRNLLRLKLDWGSRKPAREADMGLLYLQKGIRWIPAYKVRHRRQGRGDRATRSHAHQRVGRPRRRDGQPGRGRADLLLRRHGRPDRPGPGGGPALALLSARRPDAICLLQRHHEPSGQPYGPSRRASARDRARPGPGNRRRGEERGLVRLHAPPRHTEKGPADGRARDVVRPEVRGRVHG